MAALEKYCNDENLFLEICEEGGVEELVSGAALHGKNESGISISFCKCILSLSAHGSDKVSHILRAVGVPSLVIEKMHDHRTNVEVQKIACKTLASVAASSELSRSAVATLGGPAAATLYNRKGVLKVLYDLKISGKWSSLQQAELIKTEIDSSKRQYMALQSYQMRH